MKLDSLSPRYLCAIALGVMLAAASGARAQDCPLTCDAQARACVRGARMTLRACAIGCRGGARETPAGPCFRGCLSQFLSVKDDCRTEQGKCLRGCSPRPPSPGTGGSCRPACAEHLVGCIRDVGLAARRCMRGCMTAPDRPACQNACATTARGDGATCRTTFDGCVGQCGGSPSGAFLSPRLADD